MADGIRIFTIEEANGMLPTLRNWLKALQDESRFLSVILENRQRDQLYDSVLLADSDEAFDGDYQAVLARMVELRQRITSLGVVLRNGPEGGCDLPSMLEGRLVYLCWQPNEPEIEWWHDVGSGYASRVPLYETIK